MTMTDVEKQLSLAVVFTVRLWDKIHLCMEYDHD